MSGRAEAGKWELEMTDVSPSGGAGWEARAKAAATITVQLAAAVTALATAVKAVSSLLL